MLLIYAFFNKRKQKQKNVFFGVPKGSILGPIS